MNSTPSNAITEPTDSSIPPMMMTKASAMEKMPNNPTWLAVFERLPASRNRGLMKATTAPTTRIRTSRLRSFLCKVPRLNCVADGKLEHIVLAELAAIKESRNRALVHHRDAVADPDDLLHVARNHQDRDAGVGKAAQHVVDLLFGPDVDAARRLVEDQDLRPHREPFGEHDFLLVAAGQ